MMPQLNRITRSFALISLAACAAIFLVTFHSNRGEDSAASEQAALQTSLFLLPDVERPPRHYTGKW